MKVLFLTEVLSFHLIPRDYPQAGDGLTLSLRNEFTDAVITPAITFATLGKQLVVTLTTQPTDFKTQNKYEATLKNGSTVIYLGKIIVLDSGTDIQNYQYNTQTNVRFDYK
jgi:hypothetical protein